MQQIRECGRLGSWLKGQNTKNKGSLTEVEHVLKFSVPGSVGIGAQGGRHRLQCEFSKWNHESPNPEGLLCFNETALSAPGTTTNTEHFLWDEG